MKCAFEANHRKKQVEKLSRSDEQSAFLTGGISSVAKFFIFFIEKQKK
jgi:hypothetical protein